MSDVRSCRYINIRAALYCGAFFRVVQIFYLCLGSHVLCCVGSVSIDAGRRGTIPAVSPLPASAFDSHLVLTFTDQAGDMCAAFI